MTSAHPIETGTDTVLAEVVDRVGIITLNRPERRNALHAEMYVAVPALLEEFGADDSIGCVLITGSGSAFCAGGDVRDGNSGKQAPGERDATVDVEAKVRAQSAQLADNAKMVTLLHRMPKVTIAALPGAAVGAGMSIALAADLRIAARSARLIPGWSKLAFSGDFGGAWFLARLVGPAKALELLIADEPVDAEAGLRLGLFNRVADDAELRDTAFRWAAQIAAGPTSAFAGTKANVLDAQRLPLEQALLAESERMVRSGMTAEHRAAVKAWLAAAAAKSGVRS
ncbi:enoyl-CoA hydratase-related protein [Mycolicibacterium novocastrense]|nr:enoyl-CoA hydratase-related protein [Mycolicibacterium novocastrense]